jgi:putative DNA primase/helicase
MPDLDQTVPAELRNLRQWVLWRMEQRKGKQTKVPYQADGEPASSTDPETWTRFDRACYASETRDFSGIGLVFSADDPYLGIDFDHVLDPETGELQPWAADIIEALDSYAEISPSGTGIKVWVRATMPGPRRKQTKLPADWQAGPGAAVELYDRERYFTVTGQQWGDHAIIEDRQAVVDQLYADLFPAKPPKVAPQPVPAGAGRASDLTDGDLIDRAQRATNGAAFTALWNGDTSGNAGDHSAADLALVNHLMFWTDGSRRLPGEDLRQGARGVHRRLPA